MIDPPPPHPPIDWLARVEIQVVDWSHWSKNRAWRSGRGRTPYLTKDADRARGSLASALRVALRDRPLPEGRYWVALHVLRPSMRADAQNALDGVLDAVQVAVGVDDRHAAVHGVTWELRPEDPALVVWVGVEPGGPVVDAAPRRRKPDGWQRVGEGLVRGDLRIDVEAVGRKVRWMVRRLPRGDLLRTGLADSRRGAETAAKRSIPLPRLATEE